MSEVKAEVEGHVRVVIAGGGTGGHLFPGLAVARALQARMPEAQISFAGTAAGIEGPCDSVDGVRARPDSQRGIERQVAHGSCARAALIPLGALDAWRLISRRRPDVVIGVGGYSSGPVVAIAAMRGVPAMLLEQNAVPGLTNRMLAPLVDRAGVTYEASLKYFGRKGFISGNPVRREFLEVDDDPSHDAALNASRVRVLVFGGSQGAHAINVAVVEAAPRLAAAADTLDLVCQTGTRDFDMVRAAFERHGVQGRVERFIDAMDREMKAAGLVVSRAGATTLAEVTAAGRPAILIPLPTATDDHQRQNARALENAGAAELMEQGDLTGERLADRIIRIVSDRELRVRMSAAARFARQAARGRRYCGRGDHIDGVSSPVTVLAKARRVHFIGIGGIGMSGIAELLVNLGYTVSGSDMQRTDITDRLASLGARIAQGHDAQHVSDVEVVVYSSAVRPNNPEMVAARDRGLAIVPRAEILAELMNLRQGIAVAGAHGKTTTTSMIALVLDMAGLDPTAVIGGRVSSFGSNAKLGRGKYLVAEADESDRSFLKLSPRFAVITNIDREHLEAYDGFDDLKAAFVQFANGVPANGAVIMCADDPHLRSIRGEIKRHVVTYGFDESADVVASDVQLKGFGSACTVRGRKPGGRAVELGQLQLAVPGRHNVLNALAAVAMSRELGIAWSDIARGLGGFHGAERRFQRRGEARGVVVVEDYGHHPTEIAAMVAAARPIADGAFDRRLSAASLHAHSVSVE
jgi:UDP-N-acetylmuramate--alanine ligase